MFRSGVGARRSSSSGSRFHMMRPLQRLQKAPVVLLPLIVSAALVTILIVLTTFKLAIVKLQQSDPLNLPIPMSYGPLPGEVHMALLYFATSPNATQQTQEEIHASMSVLLERGPCNFLVFGMWYESLLWATFNYGGRTVFLEETREWVLKGRRQKPQLEAYKVNYNTNLGEAENLLIMSRKLRSSSCSADQNQNMGESTCPLALTPRQGVGQSLLDVEWDVIMIDGPRSYEDPTFPGRMSAIFTSGVLARRARSNYGYVDVFVHDVSRPIEDKFSREFLCMANLVKKVGDLWHFQIYPSVVPDFCPNLP